MLQNKTWFIDFDGTLVTQKSHMKDDDFILPTTKDFFEKVVKENDHVIITTARSHDHKDRIEKFLNLNNIKFDLVLCGLPTGSRILINDKKPDGVLTAYAHNLNRDEGINIFEFIEANERPQES